jgi:uncharacterized protein (TIGR00106 family)
MVVVDVTIVPIGTDSPSISKYVADCHKVLKDFPALKWQLNPGTSTIEGELPEVMQAIMKMHEVPFEEGAMRVSTLIKIDDRRDKQGSIEQKLNSVREKL